MARKLSNDERSAGYHPKVSIDVTTFVNMKTKCRFVDADYGEFWTRPCDAKYKKIRHPLAREQKINETNQKKYGCNRPMQNRDIHVRKARNTVEKVVVKHWETNELVPVDSGWEYHYIRWLNANKIRYDFQVPFTLSDGHIYYVDFYLIDADKYVEIKGRHRSGKSLQNWRELQAAFPGKTELLNERKLQAMGII